MLSTPFPGFLEVYEEYTGEELAFNSLSGIRDRRASAVTSLGSFNSLSGILMIPKEMLNNEYDFQLPFRDSVHFQYPLDGLPVLLSTPFPGFTGERRNTAC